jgi:hypothetical protein
MRKLNSWSVQWWTDSTSRSWKGEAFAGGGEAAASVIGRLIRG